MSKVTDLLIKHGLDGLIAKNDDSFKNNLIQALSMKLNESFLEIKKEISKGLLRRPLETNSSENLVEFVKFIETFKPGIYTFKNGSNINISDSDVGYIKTLFESLNAANRTKMVNELFEDGTKFKQTLEFAKKTKNLL